MHENYSGPQQSFPSNCMVVQRASSDLKLERLSLQLEAVYPRDASCEANASSQTLSNQLCLAYPFTLLFITVLD